ncbi:MAG TPA: hypothetical protein VET24_08585 [Actinomycetota bacterium]|nr:hypothetical protein [Actinomycetota bacterium]
MHTFPETGTKQIRAAILALVAVLLVPASASAQQAGATAQQAGAAAQNAELTFSLSSTVGPSGASVTVTSVDPCPIPAGAVTATVVFTQLLGDLNSHGVLSPTAGFTVQADGSWAGSATVRGAGHLLLAPACAASNGTYASYGTLLYTIRTSGAGYWLPENDGSLVATYGDAAPYVPPGFPAGGPITFHGAVTGFAALPATGTGYWEAAADGGVFAFGDAGFYGSAVGLRLNRPIVGMVATPDGRGYWLVGADGGVFAFGDAAYYGSAVTCLPLTLVIPRGCIGPRTSVIVGMAATPDGRGYWLADSKGIIYDFGDAIPLAQQIAPGIVGSSGYTHPNQPVVGIARTPDGRGAWLAMGDGGVFSFGDAAFYGSAVGLRLNKPATGMAATADGRGYWLAGADGGVFAFGDAAFYGSSAGAGPTATVFAIDSTPGIPG